MADPDSKSPPKPTVKQVDGATDKQHAFKLKRILLKVSVRTDFLVRPPFLVNTGAKGAVEYHFSPGEPVPNASVVLPYATLVKTDNGGIAKLDVTDVPDGTYDLVIFKNTPPAAYTTEIAGPETAKDMSATPDRMYRALTIAVTLAGGTLKAAVDPYNPDSLMTWGRIGNRNQTSISEDHLPVDYRPVWMKSPREISKRPLTDVTSVTCHCTGGAVASGSINRFISPLHYDTDKSKEDVGSAHYLIDHDGHIIKFCRDDYLVYHVGAPCVWDGHNNVNPFATGIEMVHRTQEHPNPKDARHDADEISYNKYQIDALLGLLERLQGDTRAKIEKRRIFGHGDADLGGSRDSDPGQNFPWETLEGAGWGMIPQAGVSMDKAYGGFFDALPASSLQSGNHDGVEDTNPRKRIAALYGSAKDKPANPLPAPGTQPAIKELQEDLSKIGYTTPVTGTYDARTLQQVQKFQWHFFSVSRKRAATGRVDLETATMIKSVRAAVP